MKINEAVFERFPVLKSKRLVLRDITHADAEQIYTMRAHGRINEFITREPMPAQQDANMLIEKTIATYKNRQGIDWAGVLRDQHTIIGTCGFNSIDFANLRAEIGGELAVDYWGKHIAVEAVSTIVKFGLHTMNLHTIEAKVSPQNRGAIFLLEHLGFSKEAHFRERIYFKQTFHDIAVYTLLKGQEQHMM